MEERAEEVPNEISRDSIQDLITSKNFKNRILAYQNINRFPEFVGLLQKETLAVALEVALDSLLGFPEPLSSCQISALYGQFSQSKSSIKAKLSELIEQVFLNDRQGVIKGLAEAFNHKSPKVVSSCVGKVNTLIRSNIDEFSSKEWKKSLTEDVCSKLGSLFGSVDKDVKSEATALTITLSHIFFDEIYQFIENVKPIILKDLKDALKDVEFPKKCLNLGDFNFDHPDWKERLGCMNFLKENIGRMANANEAYPVICRKTRDVNLSVTMAAIETIKNGRISHPDCIKGMIERFKDKRPSLSTLIKGSIELIKPDINILIDSLDNKNPEIKVGVLECLSYYNGVTRVKDIAKTLEDSSADVRSRAVDILSRVDSLDELTQSQKLRISKSKKLGPSNSKATDLAAPTRQHIMPSIGTAKPMNSKAPSSSPSASLEPVASGSPSKFNFSLDSTARNKIYESFVDKYPLFLEKDWNKRLEYLQERKKAIEKENLEELSLFLLSCKESNFYILKEILDIFKNAKEQLPYQLCSYLNSKITEPKLRNDVIAILKNFDQDFVIQNFIHQLKANKSGRKCVSLLEVFGVLVSGPSSEVDEFLRTFKCVGVTEKKALADFIGMYERSKRAAPKKVPNVEQEVVSVDASHQDTKVYDRGYQSNALDIKQSCPVQILKADCSSLKSKELKRNLGDVFTSEFLSLAENDPLSGVSMLESIDIISLSDVIIQMYCKLDLPSPYFNSLILRFISKKYILGEDEATFLVGHLLNKRMESEMELIDRIYPATKLYKILRMSSEEEGVRSILRLLAKYKGIDNLKANEVERAVRENEDFIGFTVDMDRAVALKLEMQEKFMKDIIPETVDNCFARDHSMPGESMDFVANQSTMPAVTKTVTGHPVADGVVLQGFSPETKVECQNEMQEDNDSLDYLESSFVIGNSVADEATPADAKESPSILRAPSMAIRDSLLDVVNSSSIKPPSILETNLFSDIEKSLDNITIVTTPRKKKRNLGEVEEILSRISCEDLNVAKDALVRLNRLISEDAESLKFSSNTIIGSVMAQLMDRYNDQDFRSMSLAVLLKFTQSVSHCSSLRYETLKSVHADLISIVKEDNTIADILINLCLNCDVQLLRVYFDLLEDSNEILMKLIWRHSKRVDYSSMETVGVVMMVIDSFYTGKKNILSQAENVLLKVCLLHLKECISSFSDNVKEFGIGTVTESIVDLLVGCRDFSLDKVRECFKQ